MTLENTMKKVEEDIAQGNLGKARDRLHGLISSYPSNLNLRKQLGAIYWKLQYPAMAGRYWYLEKDNSPEMISARNAFEKDCADDPYLIRKSLKFRGNFDEIRDEFAIDILKSLEKREKKMSGKVMYSESVTNGQRQKVQMLLVLFFILLIIALIIVGAITVINWIF